MIKLQENPRFWPYLPIFFEHPMQMDRIRESTFMNPIMKRSTTMSTISTLTPYGHRMIILKMGSATMRLNKPTVEAYPPTIFLLRIERSQLSPFAKCRFALSSPAPPPGPSPQSGHAPDHGADSAPRALPAVCQRVGTAPPAPSRAPPSLN
ncbi:hypothetical protein EVAR_64634_1 [Eumeta japonica]|uniref:Uncharacterized protein n=1 Tax=Eumeta variegata TaxID=151549 RepID=A0A4C1ZCS3_EUMVA|nr:hypothetical protein EVAR_64634_1 [Eumeta japonica]